MRAWLLALVATVACATPHEASRSRDGSFRALIAQDSSAVRECGDRPPRIVDVTPSLPLCREGEEPFPPTQCLPFTGRPGENSLCRVGDPGCCRMTEGAQRCVGAREYEVCDGLRFLCDARSGCVPVLEEPATFNRG